MNVLVIGSGGREHALCHAIARSPLVQRLFCAPGNAGIAKVATLAALEVSDHAAVIAFCRAEQIGFVVIGPEAPLVAGLADDLGAAGILAFGPSKAAAQLEGSKGFTKDLCARFGIPTAAYARFDSMAPAKAYIRAQGAPIVIKADGLAAGKGVVVAMDEAEALAAVDMMFAGGMGAAGAQVVIEEFMEGEEASFFALADGHSAVMLGSAQDHKRVGDGDTGPNTGGMGAYSPAPVMTEALSRQVMETIIKPTVDGMAAQGRPFKGVLFAGLMLTKAGPKLIEYNCRFGDPECQVLMLRMAEDILPWLVATAKGVLPEHGPQLADHAALTVVMAAKGYPDAPQKGTVIKGVAAAEACDGVTVFHAGTALKDGALIATGGRVLNVTAVGDTVAEAQARAYAGVAAIDWPGGFCRKDIGWRALARL